MQAIIIAAGESSRFWPLNKEHKSQLYLLGKPIIYWTIKGLLKNGIKDIIVVCSKDSTIPAMLKKENDLGVGAKLDFVVQQEPLGTGNAVWQAKDLIGGPFLVVWPDKVNSRELIAQMKARQERDNTQAVLVGVETSTPWDYGIARLEGEIVREIVENPEQGKEPSHIKITGAYLLQSDFLQYYEKLPKHHEADFIEAINLYLKDKKASLVKLQEDVPTLKYAWESFGILDILFHSENFQPGIHETAKIGQNVVMKGDVRIGANTVIKDNTVIVGPCFIGENCEIGYSNVLRGPLNLERGVKTAAFCEIKHSIVQEDTHFHSGYVGDSIIGRNCRFGAGFIAANRRFDRNTIKTVVKDKKIDTGLTSFGCVVGNNTNFGIHSGTMPGVLIGKECIVYPGVHVFENMPDGSLLKH